MEHSQSSRATHVAQGTGFVSSVRRPRRGRRRAHAVTGAGGRRAARVVVVVGVLALAGILLVVAPATQASAAELSTPTLSSPVTDVPGRDGWFEGVSATVDDLWAEVTAFVSRASGQIQVQLAEIGRSASGLWHRLP